MELVGLSFAFVAAYWITVDYAIYWKKEKAPTAASPGLDQVAAQKRFAELEKAQVDLLKEFNSLKSAIVLKQSFGK